MRMGTRARLAALLVMLGVSAISAQAQHTFDGNILYNNNPTNCTSGGSATFDGCALLNTLFTHNDQVDPLLGSPANHNWVPAENSIAVYPNDDVVNIIVRANECDNCPSCTNGLTPACYRGALPPASMGEDWTQGWTDYTVDGAGRVYPVRPVVILTGDQASSLHLTKDNHYLLRGRVTMLAGTTITIDPGVYIFGEFATLGFLVVDRGAKIIAPGTKSEPIIMTTDELPGQMAPGGWGGLVINGRAISNCADCRNGASCISEGTEVEHCGNDDCDDSGVLCYVRVEFAGKEIAPANELNAFTFNSVGCGTYVRYLQANRGLDDLFEWFGGKTQARYLVGTNGGDDGLDWQMGFRGQIQFAVIQQYGINGSDKGIEADNNEFDFNAPCRSNPTVANVTLIALNGGSCTHGIHFRRGTDANVYNSIVMGWPSTGIRVQHDETSARGAWPNPGVLTSCVTNDVDPTDDLASSLVVRTFPNPAVDQARIFFSLPQAGRTRVEIFDPAGRLVERLADEEMASGAHQLTWNVPAGGPSGAWFYRVQSGDRVATGRLVTAR